MSGCVTLNEYEKKTNDRDVSRLIDDTFVRDRVTMARRKGHKKKKNKKKNKQKKRHRHLAVKFETTPKNFSPTKLQLLVLLHILGVLLLVQNPYINEVKI